MYRSIVVGTDGTTRSRLAVQHAADLARIAGATLHLVGAYRTPSLVGAAMAPEAGVLVPTSGDADVQHSVEEMLEEIAGDIRRSGVEVQTYACAYAAADALCEIVKTHDADLIVVGDKGMHGARRLLGSVPNAVAHQARCAVLIFPTG